MALHTLLSKSATCSAEHVESQSTSYGMGMTISSDSKLKGKSSFGISSCDERLESDLGNLSLQDGQDVHKTSDNILVELTDCMVDFQTGATTFQSKQQVQHHEGTQSNLGPRYPCNAEQSASLNNSFSDTDEVRTSLSYVEMPIGVVTSGPVSNTLAVEGPSEDSSYYHLNNNSWLAGDQAGPCTSINSCNEFLLTDMGRCGIPSLSWGGRVVGRRQVKGFAKGNIGIQGEEYDAFYNIFEGGSLLFCNMSFEALLNVRKQLEELGFPCKAVNDALWLQVCCLCHFFFISLSVFM